jgi:valyl-tRNA synthetase
MGAVKLLHPFMPFVTEEIWEKLPGTDGSIMIARFPEASDYIKDENALKEMNLLMGVITGIRNIRGEMNISPSKKVNILIDVAEKEEADFLISNLVHIKTLAKVEDATIASGIPKPEASATAVFGQNQIHVILKGILDFQEERKRLGKQIEKIEKEIKVSNRKLSNKGFLEKAPAEIVEEVREKVETMTLKLEKLNQNLRFFEKLQNH